MRNLAKLTAAVVLLFGLSACGDTWGQRAVTGGAIGAGSGAVVGAATGFAAGTGTAWMTPGAGWMTPWGAASITAGTGGGGSAGGWWAWATAGPNHATRPRGNLQPARATDRICRL